MFENRNQGKTFPVVPFMLYDKMAALPMILVVLAVMVFAGCTGKGNVSQKEITAEMAYEGVSNYCHSVYDWSAAEENSDIMGLTMGEETDSAYHVVFRSYTGALVNFYVNKANGITKMVDYVPTLNIQEETVTINLFDYLK